MKSKIFYLGILFICAVCLCLMVSLSAAAETVKIGIVFAKTGTAAPGNLRYFMAVRFAVGKINEQGGLLGKKIELIEFDDQSKVFGARFAAKKAVKVGVIAVIGASNSSKATAMANILQQARIPMITPTATNPEVTLVGDYIFRACFIDPFQSIVAVNFAMKNLNAKKVAVLTNTGSKYSMELAKMFIEDFRKHGGKILWEGEYLKEATNFRFLLEKLKMLQPDLVFLPGASKDSGSIIKQARKMGLNLPFLGGDGWSNKMYKYGGDAINGNFFLYTWHREAFKERSQNFLQEYEKKYGKIVYAGEALTYDSISILADAIRRANSLNSDFIRDKLAATDNFQGITGNISFDQNGDPVKPVVILKFQNKTSVFVKTVNP
ncbi:branched-chain amino acid transport system substrate-binding protein [Candidatus Magnetomoraceae bacterium gMMP-1]